MVNINKLRANMVEHGMNVDSLSSETGIPKCRLYRRFKNPEEFTMEEADAIIAALGTDYDSAISIFFIPPLA